MDLVREVCSAAHAVRKAAGRRTRLPLSTLTVAMEAPQRLAPYVGIIADEVNVKDVVLTDSVAEVADEVLALVPAALGPRLGPDTQRVIGAVKRGDWSRDAAGVTAAGVALLAGEYDLVLTPRDGERGRTLPGGAGVIVLDTEITDALAAEGLARDVVREIQAARKDAGLHVADWVTLVLTAPAATVAAVEAHRAYVMEQTLASGLELVAGDDVSVQVAKAARPAR
jgi:isoleucyl-tRNA synthetase